MEIWFVLFSLCILGIALFIWVSPIILAYKLHCIKGYKNSFSWFLAIFTNFFYLLYAIGLPDRSFSSIQNNNTTIIKEMPTPTKPKTFCEKCGNEIPESITHCPHCNTNIMNQIYENTQVPQGKIIFCPNCKHQIFSNENFCPNCGEKVER